MTRTTEESLKKSQPLYNSGTNIWLCLFGESARLDPSYHRIARYARNKFTKYDNATRTVE